ncbi:MAG: imidazole glycerol phosphate synthase subunit HisH [Bacteroidia bacterium]|nr:imidazole glycerol phosphate synthase subunit HisH [Bacteroidia bacterium]
MLKTAPPHAKKPNVVIVDYGLGNPASIQNMLRRLGYNSLITSAVEAIHAADKIILPGVGAFAKGMQNLKESGLSEILNRKVLQEKTPVLGICLGMQLITLHSEEGNADGLGWIPAQTKKFSFNDNAKLPVPHMGWMDINIEKNHPLFRNSGNNPRYYFAHSYYISHDTPYSIATATYGITFACAFARENIMGVQFHPEKSHSFGLNILNNFILHL